MKKRKWLAFCSQLGIVPLVFLYSSLLTAQHVAPDTTSDWMNKTAGNPFETDIKDVALRSFATPPLVPGRPTKVLKGITLNQLIRAALTRHPSISAAAASLAQRNSAVGLAKSAYWPQVQAGLSSGDNVWTIGHQQSLMLYASQTMYDFGKIKNTVKTSESFVKQQKANTLDTIDDVALETAEALINIHRYHALSRLAAAHCAKIKHVVGIAVLRARSGLATQADPMQAASRYDNARSLLLDNQILVTHWEARLRHLTGVPPPYDFAPLPSRLFARAKLNKNPAPNRLPSVIAAEYERQAALAQKDLAHANRMPTFSLEGAINQQITGVSLFNNMDIRNNHTVLLKVSSAPWQGGSRGLTEQAARYGIQAARAKRDAAYVHVVDRINDYREHIWGTQQRLKLLDAREHNIVRTRALYEEQYTIGHRSILDLLNAEQEIQVAASERENARYNLWLYVVKYIAITGRTRTVYALNHSTIQGIEL